MNRISILTRAVCFQPSHSLIFNTCTRRGFRTVPCTFNSNKSNGSRQNSWNLPAIDKLVDKGIIELGPNGQPIFKPNTKIEQEEEDEEETPQLQEPHKYGPKHSKDKKTNGFDKSTLEKNLDLDLTENELRNLFPGIKPALQSQLVSTLDAKAIQVLKRRPELGPKLISTLGIDNIQQEIQQDGQDTESFQEYLQKKNYKSTRVPLGWRKDQSLPPWKRQLYGLREKFDGESWNPKKKLSREAMEGIRLLKQHMPHMNSGDIAKMFKIPTESVRRILKTKWQPSEQEMDKMAERWVRRGERVKQELKAERREQRLKEMEKRQDEKAHKETIRAANGETTESSGSGQFKPGPKKTNRFTKTNKSRSEFKKSKSQKPEKYDVPKFTDINDQLF